MDTARRHTEWNRWCSYLSRHSLADPYLRDLSPAARLNVLLAFTASRRTERLRGDQPLRAGTVASTLRMVGQTFQLAGFPDPRLTPAGSLHLALGRLLHRYRTADPATQSQIALPVSLFTDILQHEGQAPSEGLRAAADWIVIAFFFLLRVGEYTKPASRTRTTQFRLRDITFWTTQPNSRRLALPPDANLATLSQAAEVTLRLENEKNSQRDATLHHEACPGALCPVKALARRYVTARACTSDACETLLCRYAPDHALTPTMVTTVLHRAAIRLNLWRQGYDLSRIGTHSIRASGAMALFLNNVPADRIKKVGRWRSDTWLTYIHSQIASLTYGLSRTMSRPVLFHNIATRTHPSL